MRISSWLIPLAIANLATAKETVLGVYIFSRHGDRTAKSTPPSNLTDLGYQEVFTSGTYFRNRYVAADATRRIHGLDSDLIKQSQITASAPSDVVIANSAQGFLQGLYPPVGEQLGSNTLRNGTLIRSPLNGYQLIPIQAIQSGSDSENSAWLQGSTNCANAMISSNNYFVSAQFLETLNYTQSLYERIYPDVAKTFTEDQTNFQNAYVVWDLLNVASIHNASATLPDDDDFFQLKTLADQHEFGLAYNASEPIRAVTGSILGAQVVSALNTTISGHGASKLNIQFGAYGGMLSFFGLSNLTSVKPDFYGVPDYASTLTWELVTNATVNSSSWPSADDIYVRFLFHNGTTSNISEPVEYPLFGSNKSPVPWNDFVNGMNKFAVSGQAAWCQACGNSTGVCSAAALDTDSGTPSGGGNPSSSKSGGSGISKAVCGVIGAMVTLGVVLGAELLLMLLGGLRLVSKKRLRDPATNGVASDGRGKSGA
ncbi:hypothetical protein H2202_010118 [Exophiala xenobiotica]|nr:hypothetical protein H2202_010118 [Exophiala xenobiotica]KAK5206787.1 hypothetical protein LTR41_007320 [Exophiala xenobiotica]KAK5225048.1 hypothetical protein LTR47_009651 [Exophiala xenobiotica]KAK5250544.1 hypothetical protein LTS06_004607 [Exophiala xenobiotica]KAK5262307.1 hypothetical protein LTR40_000432 [Exophiala xenobiotica]